MVPGAVRTVGERKVYRLTLQHQPKIVPEELRISLFLPDGARAIEAEGWKRDGNELVFNDELDEDMELEVSWEE